MVGNCRREVQRDRLATEIGPPASLLAFDPRESNPEKTVVHIFDDVLGLSGFTEAGPDVFYITSANTTPANIRPPASATHVWHVGYSGNTTDPEILLIGCRQ